ncbi:MAG TPA: dihydroorotate dehydrogenase electron transfer subunit [Candidatus Baltobacteraceae bacterium]
MEAVGTSSLVHETTVLDRREPARDVVILVLNAPRFARVTKPGQFLMVVPPHGGAAATALGVYDVDGDRVCLLFFVCGPRTLELAALRAGDRLDCFGPLGNGFDHDAAGGDVAIVAGGVGIASVLLSARALRGRDARVGLYYGARNAARLVEAQRFADEGCELHLATDDGSAGHRGPVTELLSRDLATRDTIRANAPMSILACGPTPMLRAVARIAAQHDVRAQLSLEETFACGVGGCWGCVVALDANSAQAPPFPGPDRHGSDTVHARICKEGPVFWSHELRW